MEPDLNTEKVATTKKFGSLSETTKICRFCLNASGTDSIINLFGTFAEELNVVGIISQHFWFKPEPSDSCCNAICTDCWQKIEAFHLFYTSVKIVQDKLISDQSTFSSPLSPNFIGLVTTENLEINLKDKNNDDEYCWKSDPITNAESDNDTDYLAKSSKYKKKLHKIKNKESPPPSLKKQKSTTLSHEYDFNEDQQIRQFFLLNCDLCVDTPQSLTFNSHLDYLIHFRKVHNIDRRSIICSICKTRSLTREQIRQHICWHLNPDAYKCDICNRSCKSRYLLEVHKTQHIPEKPFECDICAQKFATKLLIYFHMYKHHSGKPSSSTSSSTSQTNNKPRKNLKKNEKLSSDATIISMRKFHHQCVQCDETFDKKSALKIHRERVHGHLEYICDICGKGYTDRGQLRKHVTSNHVPIDERPMVQCQQCNQSFTSRYLLNKHVRYDHEGISDESVCTQCGKTFKTGERLKIHIRVIHRNHRPAKCNYCGKGFKDTCILRDHIAGVHTGEPQYKCAVIKCSKTFRSAGSYYKHGKRMHTSTEWEEAVRARQANGGSWRL